MSVEHYSLEGTKISYQVVRIEQFTKGSLGKIGGETERTSWTIVKEIDRKKRKERTELKKSFLWWGGGIIMLEKRNYVQIG